MKRTGQTVRTALAVAVAGVLLWAPLEIVEAQNQAGRDADSAGGPSATPVAAVATAAAEAPAAAPIGSAACKACHGKVATAWSASPHGQAMSQASLPEDQRGCEACHGPGSQHAASGGKTRLFVPKPDDPKSADAMCGKCHFPDASSGGPANGKSISSTHFARSAHSRKGMSCVSCHAGHPTANDAQLLSPSPDLCLQCHAKVLESAPGKKAAYTHSPVAEGDCMTCHNPHGSADRTMVVKDLRSACLTCHDVTDEAVAKAHDGYPVEGSQCATCHDPHSHNQEAKLVRSVKHASFKHGQCETCHTKPVEGQPVGLKKPAGELCLSCHKASAITPAGEHAHAPAKAGQCLSCHNPHASNRESLLKPRPENSCLTCHNKVETATMSAHKHNVFNDNTHCASCHEPHSSPHANLMVKDEVGMCGQCHKHSFSHPIGKKADGKMVLNPTNGDPLVCSSCHDIHGSKHEALTIADKGRDLCVVCHKGLEH